MRAADLARAHLAGTTADQGHGRAGVVRGPERWHAHQPAGRQGDARSRMDRRHLEGVVARQPRQQPRHGLGDHRLAGARRTDEQHVMAAGGGDLDGAASEGLALHVAPGRHRPSAVAAPRRGAGSCQLLSPRRQSMTSSRSPAHSTVTSGTSAASAWLAGEMTAAFVAAAATRGNAPTTGRNVPSRPSSATNATPATSAGSSWPVATRIPTAMARSRPAPRLRDARRREVDGDLEIGPGRHRST